MLQPPVAQRSGGLSDGKHFGVGRRVVELLALVVGRADHPVVAPLNVVVDHDRPDRHFVLLPGQRSFSQRLPHVVFVGQIVWIGQHH
jgi:hypothetical protein